MPFELFLRVFPPKKSLDYTKITDFVLIAFRQTLGGQLDDEEQ